MIEIEELCRSFGAIKAVDKVSFTVAKGEIVALLGPNGAGKTTTMRLVSGYLHQSSGQVRLMGHDTLQEPTQCKRILGYLPEGAPSYDDLTPLAMLRFCARIRGFQGEQAKQVVADAVQKLELKDVLGQRIETLSKGFKRRVALAQSLLHNPPVLLLDEPTDGLDPNQKHQVRNLIRERSAHCVTVISTHLLEEVHALCSRTVIIAAGKVVADAKPAELQKRSKWCNVVSLQVQPEHQQQTLTALRSHDAFSQVYPMDEESVIRVHPHEGEAILTQVLDCCSRAQSNVLSASVDPGQLDDVFRTITEQHTLN